MKAGPVTEDMNDRAQPVLSGPLIDFHSIPGLQPVFLKSADILTCAGVDVRAIDTFTLLIGAAIRSSDIAHVKYAHHREELELSSL